MQSSCCFSLFTLDPRVIDLSKQPFVFYGPHSVCESDKTRVLLVFRESRKKQAREKGKSGALGEITVGGGGGGKVMSEGLGRI